MMFITKKNAYYDYFWNQIDYHNVYTEYVSDQDIGMEGMNTKYTIRYV